VNSLPQHFLCDVEEMRMALTGEISVSVCSSVVRATRFVKLYAHPLACKMETAHFLVSRWITSMWSCSITFVESLS
jgi:hypothetical protein